MFQSTNQVKEILKDKGTLKEEKKSFKKIDSKNRKLSSVYEAWISGKESIKVIIQSEYTKVVTMPILNFKTK